LLVLYSSINASHSLRYFVIRRSHPLCSLCLPHPLAQSC
jgi:hypothetical protein